MLQGRRPWRHPATSLLRVRLCSRAEARGVIPQLADAVPLFAVRLGAGRPDVVQTGLGRRPPLRLIERPLVLDHVLRRPRLAVLATRHPRGDISNIHIHPGGCTPHRLPAILQFVVQAFLRGFFLPLRLF